MGWEDLCRIEYLHLTVLGSHSIPVSEIPNSFANGLPYLLLLLFFAVDRNFRK